MVRLRQRYMLCELTHKSGDRFRICPLSKTEIEQAVRAQLAKSYGAYGTALCRDSTVKYYHRPTGMVIFRFAPKGQHIFGSAIIQTTLGEFHMTIKQVAGSSRTVNKKLIKIFRSDIARLHIVFPKFEDSKAKMKENEMEEELEQLESGEGAVGF